MRQSYFDHDDHDDDDYLENDSHSDDDDDDSSHIPVFRSAVRPAVIERRLMPPTHKPAIPEVQQPFALPTKRSVILPTGRPLPAPNGRPVGRGFGRPDFRSSTHMESLPAGCLLSESLIACGNTGITQMPIIRDPGVRSLFLAGVLKAIHTCCCLKFFHKNIEVGEETIQTVLICRAKYNIVVLCVF